VRRFHCLSAFALALALLAGNLGVCAGWTATPKARMACCADGDTCPMHQADSQSSGEKRVVSQAQADACCAASERQQSSQSAPTSIPAVSSAVFGAGVVVPAPIPALVGSDAWRIVAPIPISPVPRHVLLSVFLV
jgi:hypothetical protein